MGACLLLSGMAAAIVSGPIFDRVFTHHLAVTSKCFVPFAAAGWFVLIWAGVYNLFRCLFDAYYCFQCHLFSATAQYCGFVRYYGGYWYRFCPNACSRNGAGL